MFASKISTVKSKFKKSSKTVKSILADYADSSTIHGVSYIAEKNRSRFETVFWIAVLCLSVFGCIKLILNAWNISPIIITFTEKPTPIWQIPFPAVTICPQTYARSNRINITKLFYEGPSFESLTEEEKNLTIAKAMFCYDNLYIRHDLKVKINECNECLKMLQTILIPVEEFIVECKFRHQVINCTRAFKLTIVDGKLCYAFNELGFYRQLNEENKALVEVNENWSVDEGYKSTTTLDAYPYRALGAGPKFGLSILLRSDKNKFDRVCTTYEHYMLEYRMPYDSPQFLTNHFIIPTSASFNLFASPKLMTTSDEMRNYPPQVRSCYFGNEKRLKYFKQYTQSNCEIECLADRTLGRCKCLPIFLEKQGASDICGPAQQSCLFIVKDFLFKENYGNCECLPACTSIAFDSEISVTSLNKSTLIKIVDQHREEYEYSEVNIFFKTNQILTTRRNERYGNIDFLANCGGLLGLCLGVSVLSFLEIVYFCTFRLLFRKQEVNVPELHENVTKPIKYSKLVKDFITDYCQKTTIQGVKYLAESGLTLIERIWWTIIIFISVFACGHLIFDIFRRYEQSPVIISYANEETSIAQIPFPLVTICPQYISPEVPALFDYFKVQNLSLYSLNESSIAKSTAVAQVCESDIFNSIDPESQTDCEGCAAYLTDSMCSHAQCFYFCNHVYSTQSCKFMFEKVATASGVCFTYNELPVFRNLNKSSDHPIDSWTLEGGYKNHTGRTNVYPRSGSKDELSVTMHVRPKMTDAICKGAIQGYKVYLNLPIEAAQMSKHFYMMPFYYETHLYISPKVINTAPELRAYSYAKRQCYFSDERYLRFFRHYTQNNCEIECLVNLTLNRCGCLLFHMPKIPDVKFCGISDKDCQQRVIQQNAEENIRNAESSGCQCLPTCTSISYDADVSYSRIPDAFSFMGLQITFRENQFVALERTQLYGATELLANCGGLLGLFLGFSIISVLEMIYFCTIRLFCNVKFVYAR